MSQYGISAIAISCPLCCDSVFESRELLAEHLSKYCLVSCPLCMGSFSAVVDLVHHLSLARCNPMFSETHLESCKQEDDRDTSQNYSLSNIENEPHEDNINESNTMGLVPGDQDLVDTPDPALEDTQIFELFNKPQLSLLKNNSPDYEIVEPDTQIMTQQNCDGTISITDVRVNEDTNSKSDSDLVITVNDKNPQTDTEEMYSCNTCGLTFSSVIEHIQQYHNDQYVVVEVNESGQAATVPLDPGQAVLSPIEEAECGLPADGGGADDAAQAPKRVITDTGAIVEADAKDTNGFIETNSITDYPLAEMSQEVTEVGGQDWTTRKYKVSEEKVKSRPTAKPEEPRAVFHQVIAKEMVSVATGVKTRVYHCISCSIYVSSLTAFKSHPCQTPKYKCHHCPVAYDNSKSLCAHLKAHKVTRYPAVSGQSESRMFRCDECDTVFNTSKSLKLHKRMHEPAKARADPAGNARSAAEPACDKYRCEQCDKLIPSDHRAVHDDYHGGIERFNCDICNKKFASSTYLEMHKAVHKVDKVSKQNLDKSKSLPYSCSYCGRQFARPHEKIKHERIHTGEKPHSCEICGKSFRVSYCLTLHMRTHTGARPYECRQCGKRFKSHSVYNHHLLTHGEARGYACPYCPKAFKTSVQLAGHKNSHTKPFSCEHCNRRFASLYAVRVHSETHRRQNNLKYSCEQCGATYARSFALKDHLKKVHNQEADDSLVATVNFVKGWNTNNSQTLELEEIAMLPLAECVEKETEP